MATILLKFGNSTVERPGFPLNIKDALGLVKTLYPLEQPLFKYTDEDGDVITVQTQTEYQDALDYISENSSFLEVVEETEADSLLTVSDILSSQPSHSIGVATVPPMRQDSATDAVQYKEQSSTAVPPSVEAGCLTKPIQTNDGATGTAELKEGGNDAPAQVQQFTKGTAPPAVRSQGSGLEGKLERATNPEAAQVSSVAIHANMGYAPPPGSLQNEEICELVRQTLQQELIKLHAMQSSKMRLSSNLVHQNTKCKECSTQPIIGVCFRCRICDFDVCELCEVEFDHNHPLIKLRRDASRPVEDPAVTTMKELGYKDEEMIRRVLTECGGDVNLAVEKLLF